MIIKSKSFKLKKQKREGFAVVELLLAISVFALTFTAFAGVFSFGQESSAISGNRTRAIFLAEEGLEAARNLKDESFSGLTPGTYGLVISAGRWGLSGSSDTTGIFTRQLTITDIDTKRKRVVSTVTWSQNQQRSGSVSVATRFTDWKKTTGATTCLNQSGKLSVDISGVSLSQSSRLLTNIKVQNTEATCAIVIDKVTVSWTDVTKNITRARIKNSSVWSGSATTGTLLDITNRTISNSEGQLNTDYLFNGKVNGNTFTITFTMDDGTTKVVSNITP